MQSKSIWTAYYVSIVMGVLICLSGAAANAATMVFLSTDEGETLGGLSFEDEDLAQYNTATGDATLFFNGDAAFDSEEDLNAAHVLPNGHVLLSTDGDVTLGGLTFGDDDIVEYDPVTGTASLFFDGGSLFGNDFENIDAVHVLPNGNLVISTTNSTALGGLGFEDGDLAEYNPVTDTATLFFDEDLFSGNEDIDAVHVLPNGNIVLSTADGATLGGLTFKDGDLAEYNPSTGIASLFFDEDLFSGAANINATYIIFDPSSSIPEPGSLVLLGAGALGMATRRRAG